MFNRMRLNTQIILLVTTTIFVLMLIYLGWDSYNQRRQVLEDLHKSTAVLANSLLSTRIIIAQNQDLINKDYDGSIHFKSLNPSVVIRDISELFNGTMGYKFKQTSLNVRNPQNAPDLFEADMLQKLAGDRNLREEWTVDNTPNRPKVFRYMIPLYYERDCLNCHGEPAGELDIAGYPKEGSKLGDFAGAISILAPMDKMEQNMRDMLLVRLVSVSILWLTLTGLIYFIISKRFVQPLEHMTDLAQKFGSGNLEVRDPKIMTNYEIQTLYASFCSMAENLKELHDNLEAKVSERTNELAEAYQKLQDHQQTLQKINEKLAEASEVKSEFIDTMSHELQTPLTAMIAYAEVILYGSKQEETIEYVYDIYRSAHHLQDLITDILAMSKIEKGKMQIHPTVFELSEITSVLEPILHPLANKNNLAFSIEIPEELPAIQADKNKVKQILLNLLSNAIKFTPSGGSVNLKTCYLPEDDTLLVTVSDTGKGMPATEITRIFEKFIQLDSGTTKEYGGTGLGLAITKKLVELHGGIIWVESAPGQGSTFYVKLPLYQIPTAAL